MIGENSLSRLNMLVLLLMLVVVIPSASAEQITRDDAVKAIAHAERDIDDMRSQGLSIIAVNDSLIAANQALESADFASMVSQDERAGLGHDARKALEGIEYAHFTYAEVITHTTAIAERQKQAYDLMDRMALFYAQLDDYRKMNTSDAETILATASKTFEKERYAEAELILDDLESELERTSEMRYVSTVLLESGKGFFRRNVLGLIILSLLLISITTISWKNITRENIRKKLNNYKREHIALTRLIESTQRARYGYGRGEVGSRTTKHGMLSMLGKIHKDDTMGHRASEFEYAIRMEMYGQRKAELDEQIPVLEGHLKNI